MYRKTKSYVLLTILLLAVIFTAISPSALAAAGSWNVSKVSKSFLTSGQKKIFLKAVNGLSGVSYKPAALLAKQTVAGTNYIFLCQGTTATRKPVTSWYVMKVNKDLKKKVHIASIKKINISKIKTKKTSRSEAKEGGLEIVGRKYKSTVLPKSVRKAFKNAQKSYKGYDLRPIAMLGTQVVAGDNYKILCYGQKNSKGDLYVVTVYKNLKGKSSITECKPFNLEKYTG